jgi:hypothetical protein
VGEVVVEEYNEHEVVEYVLLLLKLYGLLQQLLLLNLINPAHDVFYDGVYVFSFLIINV